MPVVPNTQQLFPGLSAELSEKQSRLPRNGLRAALDTVRHDMGIIMKSCHLPRWDFRPIPWESEQRRVR